jgi:acetylornithine deacetylase/succinyl-diaminopimelate desuccinylase-like protein
MCRRLTRIVAPLVTVLSLTAPAAGEPNWDALTTEAAEILSRYVQIDTTNPPGNELPAARFLEQVLARDGVRATVYESAPNRANLVARLPGKGQGQPVVLLHHMDVVPAEPADWSFPPFSGEIRDGFVYGRGAIDDKSHGVVQLMALLARVREQRSCTRDLVFLAVADEEVGGDMGARWIIAHHPEAMRGGVVWNEGGASVEGLVVDRLVSSVAVTEKNSLWLTLVANGEGGHGSAPTPDDTITILTAALQRIADWDTPIHLVPSIRESLGMVGAAMFPGGGFLLRNVDTPVLGRLAAGRLTSNRATNGLIRNTIALTGLRAGVKHNVIPRYAEADLDVRLLPDQQPQAFLAELTRVIDDPRITIKPVHELPALQDPTPTDGPFYRALVGSIEQRLPGSLTVPGMLTGGSDCKSFRAAGIACYGYQPLVGTTDLLTRIHGLDERIELQNLRLGVQVTSDVVNALCAE